MHMRDERERETAPCRLFSKRRNIPVGSSEGRVDVHTEAQAHIFFQ